MECLGPRCAAMVLDWLKAQHEAAPALSLAGSQAGPAQGRQALLWASVPSQDAAPAIRSEAELAGAVEHLQYAVFRRYQNQLTKAERARLDNTIQNAFFKIDRYAERLAEADRSRVEAEVRDLRDRVRDGRELADKLRLQGRRAEQGWTARWQPGLVAHLVHPAVCACPCPCRCPGRCPGRCPRGQAFPATTRPGPSSPEAGRCAPTPGPC